MEDVIEKALLLLDLNLKQRAFLQACYKLGSTSITEIARLAKLQRSTAYLIARQLLERNLLIGDLHDYRQSIQAVSPKRLLTLISAKQRKLRRQEIELEENLPELEAKYQNSQVLPKVRVFYGKDGLLQVLEDILAINQEILLWSNQESERKFFDLKYHDQFIAERVQKQISIRVLAVDNPGGRQLLGLDQKLLRQTKILPKNIAFSAETYIYGNKVAILDFHKDIMGIIIESEPIANSHRAMFEVGWNSS